MKILSRTAWMAVVLATLMAACVHEPLVNPDPDPDPDPTDTTAQNTCDPDTVYFERDLLPIIVSNCAKSGCHDPITREEGYDFSTYASIIASGQVKPGRALDSDFYEAITETRASKVMPPPPAAPLTAEQKSIVEKWIRQGAKNLTCAEPAICDTSTVTYSGTILPLLTSNCLGCHSGSGSGGVVLDSYDNVAAFAGNGALVGVVTHDPGYTAMPLYGKLPDCDIAKVRIWVNQGFPNN